MNTKIPIYIYIGIFVLLLILGFIWVTRTSSKNNQTSVNLESTSNMNNSKQAVSSNQAVSSGLSSIMIQSPLLHTSIPPPLTVPNSYQSGKQAVSSNQGLNLTNHFLLDLTNSNSNKFNYKYNRNSCFIHSSLQLVRTFFSLLFIENKITLDEPYINTLLNFDASDPNRKQYFPDIQFYNKYEGKYYSNFMDTNQHDASEFLAGIFSKLNYYNIISYSIIINTGEEINIPYIKKYIEKYTTEYICIAISLQTLPQFTFKEVTNDIVINNGTYSPYSIIWYAGDGDSGHYINYSKKPNTTDLNGQWSWYKYDDMNKSKDIKSEEGITKNPVVILYKRIKK